MLCFWNLVESSWNMMAQGDAREGKWRGNWCNGVGSQYPSHYLRTWCIQHYYRWYAQLGCQQSTELTPPGRFKWTRPFRAKDEIWFLRVCHHISNAVYQGYILKGRGSRCVGIKSLPRSGVDCLYLLEGSTFWSQNIPTTPLIGQLRLFR